ncbi:MAG: hypothetical protein ACRDFX_11715 [Chloroflexota bacterium]
MAVASDEQLAQCAKIDMCAAIPTIALVAWQSGSLAPILASATMLEWGTE